MKQIVSGLIDCNHFLRPKKWRKIMFGGFTKLSLAEKNMLYSKKTFIGTKFGEFVPIKK